MEARILNSDNEDIKQRVMSGKTSISAVYKELTQGKNKEVDICNCCYIGFYVEKVVPQWDNDELVGWW